MKKYEQIDDGASFTLRSELQIIRAAGAILGVIAIITGLVYATRMFGLIYTVLT